MPFAVRRIVTGHDRNGKAIVASDETLAGPPPRPGISGRVEIWSADKMPVDNSEGAAAEAQRKGFVVHHNYVGSGQGNVCRVVEFASGGPKFMHRTETLDYAILLKGECDLELDDGKLVHMKEGDICVQRGTMHAWVNNSGKPCTFAFILIDADPVEEGGQKLLTHYPAG